VKVAVVGGGSTYTPELVSGLGALDVDSVTLIDPAADRLAVVGAFCRRLLDDRVTWTSDVDAGLRGADVVVIQLRVGGQAARITDETFPQACGCVGQETTGAGGFAKALRTVPVVLDVARRARELAPDAWLVCFTNPVGIVTRALLDDGHRAVGLCNVAIGVQRYLAGLLGVAPDDVVLDHAGLNHLTWVRAATVDGVDRLPELVATRAAELADDLALPVEAVRLTGTLPSYYLRYFYCHDQVVAEQRNAPTRGEQVAEIERELLAMYADPSLSTKPELLGRRGGAFYSEAAVGLLGSLRSGDGAVHAVNVRNAGTLPFLPDEAVIEVSCRVDADGPVPLPTTLAPDQAGLVAHVAAYEVLAVEAALHGGVDRVRRALLAHPLVGQLDLVERLIDAAVVAANPGFPRG
jgi:6-phospho-beta-glucosidase